MKTALFFLAPFLVVLTLMTVVIAQPGLPGPPSQSPIDGGLGFLAAAGGIYAWKKLKGASREK